MPNISLSDKVKEKLTEFMEKEGSKTYSDAVNLLLERIKQLESKGSEK